MPKAKGSTICQAIKETAPKRATAGTVSMQMMPKATSRVCVAAISPAHQDGELTHRTSRLALGLRSHRCWEFCVPA